MDKFMLHQRDADVVEIALRFGDVGERLWMPDGRHGNMLVGEDEDFKVADETSTGQAGKKDCGT